MNNRINILWIPAFSPYKGVKHAGGKTILLYTSMLAKENDIDFTLLTMCHADEIEKVKDSYSETNAQIRIVEQWDTGLKKLVRKTWNIESGINPYNRNAGLLDNWTEYFFLHEIRKMKNEGYTPDVVVLQFTQVVLLADKIQRIYPNCKIVAIEEDVAFLGYERRLLNSKGLLDTLKWRTCYNKLKRKEVALLNNISLVFANNKKDIELLEKEKVTTRIVNYSAFYQSFHNTKREYDGNHDIIFYGAMNREENWKSVIWFVQNVLPLINDKSVKLKIIGGNPHSALKNIKNPQVEVLGFVQDVGDIFSKAMCMVVPLLMGAGIKVKVLEGLSAGIPILTNSIGIEGIPAIDKKHYIHCEKADDYCRAINMLISGNIDYNEMEYNEKTLVSKTFDYNQAYKSMKEELFRLV